MYSLDLKGPLDNEDLELIVKAVEQGMNYVLSGADSRDEEARLKHTLSQAPEKLELVRLEREFPAYRPGGTPGMIDFIAFDSRENLHVVEVKLGHDLMLALQGLDYWMYATAHHTVLCGELKVQRHGPVHLDFVCGPKGASKPIGPYTANQLEALDSSIPWRFHIARDWRHEVVVTSASRRVVPAADATPAVTPPRHGSSLR